MSKMVPADCSPGKPKLLDAVREGLPAHRQPGGLTGAVISKGTRMERAVGAREAGSQSVSQNTDGTFHVRCLGVAGVGLRGWSVDQRSGGFRRRVRRFFQRETDLGTRRHGDEAEQSRTSTHQPKPLPPDHGGSFQL